MARRLSEKQYKELLEIINEQADLEVSKIEGYDELSDEEKDLTRKKIWLNFAIMLTPDSTLGKESKTALEYLDGYEDRKKVEEERKKEIEEARKAAEERLRKQEEKKRKEEEEKLEWDQMIEEHKKNYNPSGKRVKVKDMRPGYVYTFADMSLEYYYLEKEGPKYLKGCRYRDFKSELNFITNKGMVIEPLYLRDDGRYIVKLHSMQVINDYKLVPTPPGAKGLNFERTGSKIWPPENNRYTERLMFPDEEVIEVHPFPVAIYREGYTLELLPDPDRWSTTSKDTPHTKQDDYVDAWDITDFKAIGIVGIISLVLLAAGGEALSIMIMLWIFTAVAIHVKHKKTRDYVLKCREKMGVRGDGLDEHILRKPR